MPHPRDIKRNGAVLVGVPDPLLDTHVRLGAHHLDSLADGLHCPLPTFVIDLQAAQSEYAAGADVSRLVNAERIVDQRDDLRASTFRPFMEALVDQRLSRLQALVEGDVVGHGPNDLVAPV